MRPKKVEDIVILEKLAEVFRSKGYEGASLKELSDAAGLKKASLYHRFPKGKSEMAEAVFNSLGEWVDDQIFSALRNEEHAPSVRLKNGLSRISDLYDGGKSTCIFRAFSMETGLELFETHIKNGMEAWVSSFKDLGIELGCTAKEAKKKAMQTLILLQGSLVVTRVLNDSKLFERTLKEIEKSYLKE